MKAKESLIVSGLMIFLLILWLGFFVHHDARFAGSITGGIFAVLGSLLLLIPFFYSMIKRIPFLKKIVIKRISFSTLLSIHIYGAIIGAILVLIHTGHKFQGPLATFLSALLLIEIASGYVGKYLLANISKDMSEKKVLASSLEKLFSDKILTNPGSREEIKLFSSFRRFVPSLMNQNMRELIFLADSISDVEYSIKTHELFKRLFSNWLKIHIFFSFLFYLFLLLHVFGEIYFGLRWFQ